MKLSRTFGKSVLLLILAVYSVGCVPQPISPLQLEPVNPLAVTSPPVATTTTTSDTPSPSSVLQPTETISDTHVALNFTLTPFPTVSDQDRAKIIEKLINTNKNCELPCIWGITPGVSTWFDTTRFLAQINARFSSDFETVVNYTLSFEADAKDSPTEHVYNNFTFSTQNQKVVDLITAEGNGAEIPKEFPRLWKSYSPETIIVTYGEPSRVFLSTLPDSFGDRRKVGYFLWMFYDKQGFMIRYDGNADYSPQYRFCPEISDYGEIEGIYLVSVNFSNKIPLEKQDEIFESGYHKIKSLEEATGLTNEEFTNLFLQNEIPACLDVSREVWK